MIMDKQTELASKLAVSQSVKTPGVIDLGPNTWAGNSQGMDGLDLLITIDEDFTGDGTLIFQVRSADNKEMTGAKVHEQSRALTAADLKVGQLVPYYPDIDFDADQFVDMGLVVSGNISGKLSIAGISSRQTNR